MSKVRLTPFALSLASVLVSLLSTRVALAQEAPAEPPAYVPASQPYSLPFQLRPVDHGFTAQIEATLFQLERVRGSAVDPDSSKTNFTSGIHVGYFIVDALSIGAELRYQRWLKEPVAVQKSGYVDTTSFAVGPRAHFDLGNGMWLRPGVSYQRGLDAPMTAPANYNIVQVDVPFVF